MVGLAGLLRSAGEEHRFDWKDRPDRVPAREGRVKLSKTDLETGKKVRVPATKTVPLNRVDLETLKAVAKEKDSVQRPSAATKKNFRRNRPEVRFIGDSKAARYSFLKKPGETYAEFENRLPRKVVITPMGRHFRAVLNPKDEGEEPTRFSTEGIGSVILKQAGPGSTKAEKGSGERIVVSPNYVRPREGERFVPLHHYAAWKVDGEPRGIALSDYLDAKSAKVRRQMDVDTGSLTFTFSKDRIKKESLVFPKHAAFYVDEEGKLQHLQATVYNPKQVAEALGKLHQSGLLQPTEKGEISLANSMLTERGWALLEQLDKKPSGSTRHRQPNQRAKGKLPARQNIPSPDKPSKMARPIEKGRLGEGGRARLDMEREGLELTAKAVGFVPRDIMDPRFSERIGREWETERRFRRTEVRSHSGERVRLWQPTAEHKRDYPQFKRQELGHELILAAGVKRIHDRLREKGATHLAYIAERGLRSMQTRTVQATAQPHSWLNPEGDGVDGSVKGIPDGVFVFRDEEDREQAVAVEADAGGSPWANAKGYDEATLAMKDGWAQTRGMAVVYIAHTESRAMTIGQGHRMVMSLGKG